MISNVLLVQCLLLAQVPNGTTRDWARDYRVSPPAASADRWDGGAIAPFGTPSAERPGTFRPRNNRSGSSVDSSDRSLPSTPDRSYTTLDKRNRTPQDSVGSGPLTAKQWIEELLTAPPKGALSGTPVTLTDALRGIQGKQRQQGVIDAYWKLTKAVANYHAAAQVHRVVQAETDRLGRINSRGTDQSVAKLRLDAAQSRLAAVETQADLALLIRWPGDDLPLPTSQPHVGAYHTRYDAIFARRGNRLARRLHYLLPNEVEVIRAHAEMLNSLASGAEGQASDANAFRTQCSQFLDAVDEYNHNIARYVLLASQDNADGATIVPMLIKVPRERSSGSHVAGERDNRDVSVPSRGNSTRVAPTDKRSSVIPAHAEEESTETAVEQSILIQPRAETRLVPVAGNASGSRDGQNALRREDTTRRDLWRQQ